MAEPYGVFGSCILLKEVFEDDLGHLYRAGTIKGGVMDRTIWLRVLDAPGLAADPIIASFDQARAIGETMAGAQLPTEPLFFETNGVPGLGCDYVAGQPLNSVLLRVRDEAFPLQPDNALLITEKLALALTAGESIEVSGTPLAHGFLHPGLIYLSNDGEVLVTGFGVGEALLGALEDSDSIAGARAYLAPEVLTGRAPSQSADVYSLGAILFHLLTGTALPVNPDDRMAALDAAHMAWDGEGLAGDIRTVLSRAIAPVAENRFASASEFRADLDRLIYGGAYSPTTFNLALFMDRLFRSEIEEDEVALEHEAEIDVQPYITAEPEEPDISAETDTPGAETEAPEPEAVPLAKEGGSKRVLWSVIGGVAIICLIAVVFWIGRKVGPQQPPQTPTPTAAEIGARRRAQEDRLRTLTQKMVQEMMAEREEEIRQELIARQTRIEELQRRLQQSERRAARSRAAATTEAETQKQLMAEIEKQEEAQRAQQDALDAERQEAISEASKIASVDATAIGGGAALATEPGSATEDSTEVQPAENTQPVKTPSPAPTSPSPTIEPVEPSVEFGDFVSPAQADTLPVVVKSQSLTWPRNAQRSKGKGVVVVQLTVNAHGGVDEVVVLRADHTDRGIPEAVVDAASGYRYKPGTKDGVAITTHAFVTWRYDFTEP